MMSISKLIVKTLSIYSKHLFGLLALSLLIVISGYAVTWAIFPANIDKTSTYVEMNLSEQVSRMISVVIWSFKRAFLTCLTTSLFSAATTMLVCDKLSKGTSTLWGSLKQSLPRLCVVILATISLYFVIVGGFLMFIAPGILFYLWFVLTIPAVINDRLGPWAAMRQSKRISANKLAELFLVAVLLGAFAFAIHLALMILGRVVVQTLFENQSIRSLFLILLLIAKRVILLPLVTLPFIILYFDFVKSGQSDESEIVAVPCCPLSIPKTSSVDESN